MRAWELNGLTVNALLACHKFLDSEIIIIKYKKLNYCGGTAQRVM